MKNTLVKSNGKNTNSHRPHSSIVVDGPDRAPSRAMLYPVGFKPEDFSGPIIGIASTWGTARPATLHIDQLPRDAEAGATSHTLRIPPWLALVTSLR
jgi:dihydroxy-acid dehydratase